MGFGKSNDEHNASVPLRAHGECAPRETGTSDSEQISPDCNTSASGFMPLPHTSLPNSPWGNMCGTHQPYPYTPLPNSPWGNMRGTHQPYPYASLPNSPWGNMLGTHQPYPHTSLPYSPWGNMHGTHQPYPHDSRTGDHGMTGFLRFSTLQSQQIDPSLNNFRGSLRNVDGCPSGFQNTQVNVNFMPTPSKTAGGYQTNGQGGEAEGSSINCSQIVESSLNLGCGASMSHCDTNVLGTGFSNDLKVSAFHPGKVDGSFLTLGIGGNPEARAKTNSDSREIASKLMEAVGPQSSSSHIQSATSLCHNLTGTVSSIQSNRGVLPNPMYISGGWTSLNSDGGAMHGATVGISSNQYLRPHMPDAFKQLNFSQNNDMDACFADKSISRLSALQPHKCSQADPSRSSLPCNRAYACLPHPGHTRQSELASETSEPSWTATQPTTDLLWNFHSQNARDVSSSFASHPSRVGGSSVTQDYLGISMLPSEGSATHVVERGARFTSVQPDGQLFSAHKANSAQAFGNSNFPKATGLLIAEGSDNKPATVPPFPRRLGVQLDDDAIAQSANAIVLPMDMGTQPRSNVHQSRSSGSGQLTKNLPGTPIPSHRQDRLPGQFNFQRPPFSTGQSQLARPVQFSKVVPRVHHTAGQILPKTRPSHDSGVIDQPPRKRRAYKPPAVASQGHQRKFVPSHHTKMGFPTMSTPVSPHIKGPDFDQPPEPIGHKCMLCKRDLSFTPEGPVHQPSIPPSVAVLPCGHTFHDHCLQNITPEDQQKDPPCIPCALGET